MKITDLKKELSSTTYPGRGIIAGLSDNAVTRDGISRIDTDISCDLRLGHYQQILPLNICLYFTIYHRARQQQDVCPKALMNLSHMPGIPCLR